MKKQKNLIHEKDWDYLLILDACRFDYFERLHDNYLKNGKLHKVLSPASSTPNWFREVFGDYYNKDIVYVSANPFINSSVEVRGIKGYKHFYKVVDVWNQGWDENKETIPPAELNKAVIKIKKKYPNKRIVAHYMQPHAPYLTLGLSGSSIKINQIKNRESTNLFSNIRNYISKLGLRILNHRLIWKYRELFNKPPANPVDAALREVGEKGLKNAYSGNLKIVLEKIKNLSENISGKIVITTDHGELLGEGGLYEHPGWKDHPILREVPWFAFYGNKKHS